MPNAEHDFCPLSIFSRLCGQHSMTSYQSLTQQCFCVLLPKFGRLILMKIVQIFATRCDILRPKCTKFDFGWGSAPTLFVRNLQRSPRSPSWWGGGLLPLPQEPTPCFRPFGPRTGLDPPLFSHIFFRILACLKHTMERIS